MAALCVLFRARTRSASRFLLIAIFIFSVAGMLKAIDLSQPIAFFISWARAWQFCAGGIFGNGVPAEHSSQYEACKNPEHYWLDRIINTSRSYFFINKANSYPGWPAVWPRLGTAMITAAITLPVQQAWNVGRILSLAPLRWLGARSYSWNLWHWSFLIFAEIACSEFPGVLSMGATAALLIASIIFTFIEDPIRRGIALPMPPARTVLTSAASISLIIAAARLFVFVAIPGGADA